MKVFKVIKSKSVYFFLKYQKPYLKNIVLAASILLLTVLFRLPSPLITKYLIDDIVPKKDFNQLNILCIVLLIMLVFYNLAQFWLKIVLAKYRAKVRTKIETDFYKHLQKLPFSYFLNNPSGYLISRINEIANSESIMADTIIQIVQNVITFLVGVVFILNLNLKIGLVSLAVLPFFIYSIRVFHKKIKSISTELQEDRARYMAKLELNISAIERIKTYSKENSEADRISIRIKKYMNTSVKAEIISGFASVVSAFIGMIAPFFVLWFGMSEIIAGRLSLGEFVAINTFLAFIYNPAKSLTNIGYTMSQAIAGLDRVYEIFQIKEEESGVELIEQINSIEFRNVSFSYNSDSELVLNDINFKLFKGEKIALVGMSGSGKSTLIKIILKLFKSTTGDISISGKDINKINTENYRSKITYLGQNQRFLEEDLTDLFHSEKQRDLLENKFEIMNLDINTINNNINQKKVSGGEVQKLDIVEALLREPRDILIIDEGTSNIDLLSEKIVIDQLIELYKNKIVIFITHRLTTTLGFDRILFLDNNTITEDGNHLELLNRNIVYKNLWNSVENDNHYIEELK